MEAPGSTIRALLTRDGPGDVNTYRRKRRRAPLAIRRLVLTGLLAVLAAGTARAGDLAGYADVTAVQSDIDGGNQSTLRREASVTFFHAPVPLLTLQGGLHHFRFDQDVDLEGEEWRERNQADARLHWRPAPFRFSAGFTRREAVSRLGTGDVVTNLTDATLAAPLSAELKLEVRYAGQQVRDRIDPALKETRDDRLQTELSWARGRWTAALVMLRRKSENVVSAQSGRQTRQGLHAVLAPTREAAPRIRFGASADVEHERITDETSAGRVLSFLPPAGGLFSIDASPATGTLDPVVGLADGDVATPTQPEIDLGGAVEDRNLGLDLGSRRRSSALYVNLNRAPGPGLGWTVWISQDNVVWDLWDPSPAASWNAGLERYEILYPTVEARYVKLVKTGLAGATRLLVTELRALEEVTTPRAQDERSRTIARATAQIESGRKDRLLLALDLAGRLEESDEDYDDRRVLDAALRATRRTGPATHTAAWENSLQDGSTPARDLRDAALRYSLDLRFRPEIGAMVSASRRRSWVADELDQTLTSLLCETTLQPFQTVEWTVAAGRTDTRQELTDTDWRTDQARLRARLRAARSLDLSTGASWHRTATHGVPGVRIRRTLDLAAAWRPTPHLTLRGSLYLARDVLDTSSGDLALDWRLAPKLSLSGQLRRDKAGRGLDTGNTSAQLSYRFRSRGSAYLRWSDVDFADAGGRSTTSWQQGIRYAF